MKWGDDDRPYGGDASSWGVEHPHVSTIGPGVGYTLTRTGSVYLELRDVEARPRPTITVDYPNAPEKGSETVCDGTAPRPLFRASAFTEHTPNAADLRHGWDLTIRRLGGWPSPPRFTITTGDAEAVYFGGGPIPVGAS